MQRAAGVRAFEAFAETSEKVLDLVRRAVLQATGAQEHCKAPIHQITGLPIGLIEQRTIAKQPSDKVSVSRDGRCSNLVGAGRKA